MMEAIQVGIGYGAVTTLPTFFHDPYTVYNTPEETERLRKLLPRSVDEKWNCPLCNIVFEIAGQPDIDEHLAECQKSSMDNMKKTMQEEMKSMFTSFLVQKQEPNQELLELIKQLKAENSELKKKKKGK